jgi:hypothetical protein
MSRDADDLLTAYVDGISELSIDERRAVEATDRSSAASIKELLSELRALPPEGSEPDWAAMERSIHDAVAALPIRPWYRRWQWLIPAMTCATAAAALAVLWTRPAAMTVSAPDLAAAQGHPPRTTATIPEPVADPVLALWLDGRELVVDLSAPGVGDLELPDPAPADDIADDASLLPFAGLAWVDHLDDAAIDRAERWLSSPPGGGAASHGKKKG